MNTTDFDLPFFESHSLLGKATSLTIALLTGLLVAMLTFPIIKLVLKSSLKSSAQLINKKLRIVYTLLLVVLAVNITLPALQVKGVAAVYLEKILFTLLILCFAFLLVKIAAFIKALIYERNDITIANNLTERKVRTQIDFIYKLVVVIISIIAISAVFMSFESVRELGTSLLASAGIAGIIVGLAAQKSLSNLLAGFQIAFTQPIRIDDVVIVEGEWGRIEEITLTYVVVKIWDQRRLVVPIAWFLENPFQNWTRVSGDLLGSIYIYADYSLPVEAIRNELTRILQGMPLWDGLVNNVAVTDATERTIQVRLLVSAKSSGDAWDLRCMIREKMIEFIQKNYPESLPKYRTDKLNAEGV